MIDPASVALFIPPNLKDFKLKLFERIGRHITAAGGKVIRNSFTEVCDLPPEITPIVGCSIELRDTVKKWQKDRRSWIYWDRGYARRVFASWLPKGDNGGYYRWHVGSFQMQEIRKVPDDRWKALGTELKPWAKNGRHIVIAAGSRTYSRFHGIETWIADTIDALARVTDRQLVIRDKESKRPLQADLDGAHCLVTHGSNAAVESVVLGCPVVVHKSSAASLVGLTSIANVERPVYPDREPWLHSLAYNQFNESELVDGTLWKLLT